MINNKNSYKSSSITILSIVYINCLDINPFVNSILFGSDSDRKKFDNIVWSETENVTSKAVNNNLSNY